MQILNVDFMLGIGTAVGIGTLVWLLWRTRTLGELTETVPDIPFGGSYTKNSDNDPRLLDTHLFVQSDMADYRWVDPPRSSIASAEKKPRTRRVKKVVKKTVKKAAKTSRRIR